MPNVEYNNPIDSHRRAAIVKPPDAAARGVFVTAFSDQPLARACRKMSQAVTKEKVVRRRLSLEHKSSW
jgi:hypothetical protein